jgi:nicotinamidase-related amidase
LLVVIDAQRAFVDPDGSLARTYGLEEVQPEVAALDRLCDHVVERGDDAPRVFVRSEYHPGQFTDGDLNHGMAYVCVPGKNVDCEWAAGLAVSPRDVVITKREADAMRSGAFRALIERAVSDGVREIALAGFQLTTCVAASALSIAETVRPRGVRVTVIEALTGSRASSHARGASGVSRVEATRRLLKAAGVALV